LMVGQEFLIDHPLRNGRYYIVNDSSFSAEKILETYEKLAEAYSELVTKDINNKIFGEPDNFYRILKPEEYKDDVNLKHVKIGIETREHLLDWPSFKLFLLNKITACKNIEIFSETEVNNISYEYAKNHYAIHLKNDSGFVNNICLANFVINATWEWVDYFNTKVGYYRMPGDLRTNRAKAILKVKLPEALKEKNSMFFCMGPHCMFSNMGDGYGLITFAPNTNLLNSTDLIPNQEYLKIINGDLPKEDQLKISKNIIAGVSEYIPAMINAEVVELYFGTVQIEGVADIFSHDSKVHQRDYMGLKYLEDGFISLPCMKLLYGDGNAITTTALFGEFKKDILPVYDHIKQLTLKKLNENFELKSSINFKVSFLAGLGFCWFKKARPIREKSSYIIPVKDFCSAFFRKLDLNKEFFHENKMEIFANQRHKRTLNKIREAFLTEKKLISDEKLNNTMLLDKVWPWLMDYTEIKKSRENYRDKHAAEFYFSRSSPTSQKIVEYVIAHSSYLKL
ncbi:MAG: hypothetical protein REH83_06705, partial [Rickettsiella sp.]|nr:hypothetical protein [Rickettsiella sp.]